MNMAFFAIQTDRILGKKQRQGKCQGRNLETRKLLICNLEVYQVRRNRSENPGAHGGHLSEPFIEEEWKTCLAGSSITVVCESRKW